LVAHPGDHIEGILRPTLPRPTFPLTGLQRRSGKPIYRGIARGDPTMLDKTYPVSRTDAEWRSKLSPDQYQVMRAHGTEAPGSCALLAEKRPGRFTCAGCDSALFAAKLKFESGTGWPSFSDPIEGSVETTVDRSHGMVRTEVHCATCGSHLGHVFPDGPPPTHQRYCINGIAMNFAPD
jgi:peptide-methionine (R)-S-oxide reductase